MVAVHAAVGRIAAVAVVVILADVADTVVAVVVAVLGVDQKVAGLGIAAIGSTSRLHILYQ